MSKFSFDYQLDGIGWATAFFYLGNTRYRFAASYIDTPLESLLTALLWLAGFEKKLPWIDYSERNGNFICSFRWQGEPTTLCWKLTLTPPRNLKIIVHEAEDWETPPIEPPILRITQNYYDFCRIILKPLEEILRKHGPDGYEAAWMSPFPMKLYETLQQVVR